MPLLRKGVLMPIKGIDLSQPATFIDDRAGFPQNMRFSRSELRKRSGKIAYGDVMMSGQIMGLGLLELPTLNFLVRVSKTKIEQYNTATNLWGSISVTPFTGGDEDFFSFANVTESGLLIITNLLDLVRKWPGSGNTQVLGGNPPKARYACYLSPYLLLGYTNDGVDLKPWGISWCDTDNPEEWSTGNSGEALLSSEPSPLMNLVKLNEFVSAYKEKSLWLGRKVETSDIFQFDCMRTGIGLGAPRAVVDAEGKHYFMGLNDFYSWNGVREESIGGRIREEVFGKLDRDKIRRCFAMHVQDQTEVWFFIVVSGHNWPSEIWKYNYRTGFWYFDTCSELTSAIAWKRINTQTWDQDTPGSWNDALDVWDAADVVANWEEVLFGDSLGNTMKMDANAADDLGVVVDARFSTKDFVGDQMEFEKRWLRLDVWARSGGITAKLFIDYSTDSGFSWTNIPYSSTSAYVPLTNSTKKYEMYFDIWSPQIRFRFRNSESGEIFYITNFYPYYLSRDEIQKLRA